MKTHPYEPEIIMAMHDGQLPREEEADVRAHAEHCAECQAVLADLQQVSRQMREWTVEESSPRLAAAVRQETRPVVRGWVWKSAVVFAMAAVVFSIATPNLLRSRGGSAAPHELLMMPQVRQQAVGGAADRYVTLRKVPIAVLPMVIRTASLSLIAKDATQSRAQVEKIVATFHGFAQQSETSAHAFNATLSIPSASLDAAMTELRKVGTVEQESQGGEEITQRYQDLVARLANARNTEQRLNKVLAERTGKIGDVLAVENEIARVRGEIEQMDAEQRGLNKRSEFATITLKVTEEHKAELPVTAPSTGLRLWNAMVEGTIGARENAIEIAEFALRNGPSLTIWIALLFFPARWGWKRLQSRA